jgi:hypothetical protein
MKVLLASGLQLIRASYVVTIESFLLKLRLAVIQQVWFPHVPVYRLQSEAYQTRFSSPIHASFKKAGLKAH